MNIPSPGTAYSQEYLAQLVRMLTQELDRRYARDQDLEVPDARVILHSPDGARWALSVDATGALSMVDMDGNPGAFNPPPGGVNTSVQFNDGGVFGADVGFTYDKATDTLTTPFGMTAGALQVYEAADVAKIELLAGVGGSIIQTYDASAATVVWSVSLNAAYALTAAEDGTLTWGGNALWHAGNDGAGSGLDADLLDGQQGSYYLARANHTGTQTLATISDAGTAAAQNTGTSGATLPFANGNNTWSGTNAFQAITAARVTSTAEVKATGTVTVLTANSINIDFSGAGRLFVLGPDTGTIGTFTLNLYSSNASLSAVVFTASSAGLAMNLPLKAKSYTVAGVPSAATAGAGATIYVSNESGGAVLAFSDGTNWRRVTDRAVIS